MSFPSTLLRLALVASLSDREAFVNKVSDLFGGEDENNKEGAERAARLLAAYLEDLKDNLNMRSAFSGAISKSNLADKDDLDELYRMLRELTKDVKDLKDRLPDV